MQLKRSKSIGCISELYEHDICLIKSKSIDFPCTKSVSEHLIYAKDIILEIIDNMCVIKRGIHFIVQINDNGVQRIDIVNSRLAYSFIEYLGINSEEYEEYNEYWSEGCYPFIWVYRINGIIKDSGIYYDLC